VIDTGGQNEEVRGGDGDADPAVTLVPDIKVARALNNKADLVILVQVLLKEDLELVLVV